MNPIDKFLNNTTMYRMLGYTLGTLSALAVLFAFMGRFAFSPTELIVSMALLVGSAYVTDRGLGRLFAVPTNMESSLISAMILFLIVHPVDSVASGIILVLAGALSSASKFLLSYKNKHLFNPAAFAAAVLSVAGLQPVTWWVGSSVLWVPALILGALIVRKIRKTTVVLMFAATSVLVQIALLVIEQQAWGTTLQHALISSPLIFLGTVMLTEPATMPSRRKQQIVFAVLVGFLYATAWKFGPLTVYPEVALLIGNIYAFIISSKTSVRLRLKEIHRVSERVYSYVFHADAPLNFLPGQYMDWTLPHVPYDDRGNRRTFTIASSPTETEVILGLKYYEPASTYKATLHDLQPGDVMFGGHVAGNFTLPADPTQKLAFIAGGIGITPFRSMVKYLTDKKIAGDIVLVYSVSNAEEFAYLDEFQAAKQNGLTLILLSPETSSGVQLDTNSVSKLVPDYAERLFYISGPNTLVQSVKHSLRTIGIARRNIKTDYFSGY